MPGPGLPHYERAAGNLWVQVVGRLENLVGWHRTEMVRRQRSRAAIYPQVRQEGSEGALEVEGDREVVRRDLCRANQIQTQCIVGAEPGVEPEPPCEAYVAGIIGLAI